MHGDQQAERDDEGNDCEHGGSPSRVVDVRPRSAARRRRRRPRAWRRAPADRPSEAGLEGSTASKVSRLTAWMRSKRRRRPRKASTATSLAALSTAVVPGAARKACQARPRPGKSASSGASKVSAAIRRKSSLRGAALDALGPGQADRDRHAHVGRAQLRDHRGVGELHHRMHDALRMNHHLDLLGRRRRTDAAPRSLRAPCSSWWPNRPRSCGP